MTKPWVGFQSSPKPIAGSTKQSAELSLVTGQDVAAVFALFTTAAGLSTWLGQTAQCKPFVGEKFSSELAEAAVESVFISLTVPSRVVFINDFLGEIDVKLKASGGQVGCTVKVVRATVESDLESWQNQIDQTFSRLQSAVSHG